MFKVIKEMADNIADILSNLQSRFEKIDTLKTALKGKKDDDVLTNQNLKDIVNVVPLTVEDIKIILSNKLKSELKGIENNLELLVQNLRDDLNKLRDKLEGGR